VSPVEPPAGLRALKKVRTRDAILGAALDLFTSQGFERVTVAEIARRAEVSQATVFNYFRTKEDLVFEGLEDFWAALVQAVDHRPPGVSALAAFRDFLLGQGSPAATADEHARLVAITRMIVSSPALLARERESYERGARALAAAVARRGEPGAADLVTAYALLGVHRMVLDHTRELMLGGLYGRPLARRVAARARRGFSTLEDGLTR
jgi:AcrR family transcriptional regulator